MLTGERERQIASAQAVLSDLENAEMFLNFCEASPSGAQYRTAVLPFKHCFYETSSSWHALRTVPKLRRPGSFDSLFRSKSRRCALGSCHGEVSEGDPRYQRTRACLPQRFEGRLSSTCTASCLSPKTFLVITDNHACSFAFYSGLYLPALVHSDGLWFYCCSHRRL